MTLLWATAVSRFVVSQWHVCDISLPTNLVDNLLIRLLPSRRIWDLSYHNDLQFSDRQVWANSADPDQTEEVV